MKKFLFLSLLLVLCTGCDEKNKVALENRVNLVAENKPIKTTPNDESQPEVEIHPENFDKKLSATERKAQNIANAVSKLDGIDKVSVIINSDSVLLGIETKEELNDEKLIKLKNDVENEVRTLFKDVNRVSVTASKELVSRINKMADFVSDSQNLDVAPNLTETQEKIVQKLTPIV